MGDTVLASLVGVLGGFLIGDSSGTGATTVISNATKEITPRR